MSHKPLARRHAVALGIGCLAGIAAGCADPAVEVGHRPNGPPQVTRLDNVAFAAARDRLAWSDAATLCRIEAPPAAPGEPRVMFTAIGPATNERCDSVYDPRTDRLYRFEPGDRSENGDRSPTGLPSRSTVRFTSRGGRLIPDLTADARVTVDILEHFIRDHRGVAHYEPSQGGALTDPAPAGWTSRLHYRRSSSNGGGGGQSDRFAELSASAILANAEWLAAHLAPFGATTVLVEDGWQGGATGGTGAQRDWESTAPQLRSGTDHLAAAIHRLGLKAGLWLVPHGQSNLAVAQRDADAFLWRADGSSVGESAAQPDDPGQYHWLGRYVVDTSGPAGQAYLRRLFQRLAGEWGYDYFRLDGQPLVRKLYESHADRFDTPGVSAQDAYRAGLRVIREAVGPERILTAGWGVPWWAAGICDGGRTGGDTGPSWEGMQPALEATWQGYWTHGLLWHADPGAFCVGPPLNPDQARLWATLMGLTGQAAFVGDRLAELPESGVEYLRRILPPAEIRPMELYAVERPDIICLKIADAAGPRDIVGLFNWSNAETQIRLEAATLGLPPDDYLVYDVWDRRLLGRLRDGALFTLAPTSCGVLCVRRIEPDRPTLIGTSRHITQGAVDLVRFDGRGPRLSGVSRVVGGDAYEVRFLLEPGGVRFSLLNPQAEGASAEVRSEEGVGILTLRSRESREVRWSVVYAVSGE